MEITCEVNLTKQVIIPPPPPPPPPRSFLKNKKSEDLKSEKLFKSKAKNLSLADEQTSNLKYVFNCTDSVIVSYCKPLHPIIQDGPSCGIVALSMASQFFQNIEPSEILLKAREFNFSKSGEMFSAYNMAKLASLLLNCDATVINDLKNNVNVIYSHISNGFPILIPYDADKNHEPGFNNGRSAHWAVICGLCFELQKDAELSNSIDYKVISCGLKVHIAKERTLKEELLIFASNVHVYANQGKSRHMGLWELNRLLNSNNNMYELTKKYDTGSMILPAGSTLSELRDKAVLLKK